MEGNCFGGKIVDSISVEKLTVGWRSLNLHMSIYNYIIFAIIYNLD